MTHKNIHLSTFEKFFKTEEWRRNWIVENRPAEELVAHDKRMTDRDDNRKEISQKFPYTAILEGVYPGHDFASRWCWQNIGICDGKCQEGEGSEYPGCPIVLATEHISSGSYKDQKGVDHAWSEKVYMEVEEHSHEGVWCNKWLGKTGYDYGFSEYYFQNESDRDRFLAAAPTFNLGEKYEKE